MRGGAVLHKVHLARPGRYSEDIDLVAVGQAPPGHIARALWRVLEPIFGGPPSANLIEKVQLAVRNALQKSEIRRLRWDYATTAGSPLRASVKVEDGRALCRRAKVFARTRATHAAPRWSAHACRTSCSARPSRFIYSKIPWSTRPSTR